MESPTYISIMRSGKRIGQIFSQAENHPYPHDDSEYCLNAIQICGFDKISEVWGCGPFHGKKDVVVNFLPEVPYIDQKKEQYAKYVQEKLKKGEADTIQNFADWNAHNF